MIQSICPVDTTPRAADQRSLDCCRRGVHVRSRHVWIVPNFQKPIAVRIYIQVTAKFSVNLTARSAIFLIPYVQAQNHLEVKLGEQHRVRHAAVVKRTAPICSPLLPSWQLHFVFPFSMYRFTGPSRAILSRSVCDNPLRFTPPLPRIGSRVFSSAFLRPRIV
jgi:hypothetical protein